MTDLAHCDCGCIYEEAVCPNCNYKSPEDRIEELVRQRDGWEETALMYAQNVDFWKSKLTKAMKALQKISRHANRSCSAIAARALAELEGKQ